MKLSVNLAKLCEAVGNAAKVTKANSPLTVLSCVLVSCDGTRINVAGTDLMVRVTSIVDEVVSSPFGFAVDAHLLLGILSSMNGESVELDWDGGDVKIACGKVKSKFPTIPASDFPQSVDDAAIGVGMFAPDVLFAVSKMVAPFTSTGDSLVPISGVRLKTLDNGVIFIGTDGYRASRMLQDSALFPSIEISVPSRAVVLASKLLAGDEVTVKASAGRIMFSSPKVTISSGLIDGAYPNMDSVVGTEFEDDIFFDAGEMAQALKAMSPFCLKTSQVKFELVHNLLTVSTKSPAGQASVEIECESRLDTHFSFQYGFAVDAVNLFTGRMALANTQNGVYVFRKEGATDFYHMVMPLHGEPKE